MSCVGSVSGRVAGLCQPPLPTSASAMHACNRQTKLFQAFARWPTRRIIGRLMVCADRQEFFASIDSLPKAFASG